MHSIVSVPQWKFRAKFATVVTVKRRKGQQNKEEDGRKRRGDGRWIWTKPQVRPWGWTWGWETVEQWCSTPISHNFWIIINHLINGWVSSRRHSYEKRKMNQRVQSEPRKSMKQWKCEIFGPHPEAEESQTPPMTELMFRILCFLQYSDTFINIAFDLLLFWHLKSN